MKSGLNSAMIVKSCWICSRVKPPTIVDGASATCQPSDSAARFQLWSKKYCVSRISTRVCP
jgi:hypothetical protein